MTIGRRAFLASLAAGLAQAAAGLPANRNIKWALSAGLWTHYPPGPFTDILDVMKDTGFIGLRLTGFPGVLKQYGLSPSQMEREVARRGLSVATISFGGPLHDPAEHRRVVDNAREAMRFLAGFGARHLCVFPPARMRPGAAAEAGFRAMCEGFNRVGEAAVEMGFLAGVHNHLNEMVEGPDEVDRCMALTDAKLFHFAPDTAHLHLGGCRVVETFSRYRQRIVFLDYKDARWTTPASGVTLPNGRVLRKDTPEAKFMESIYDLGDGEIDFPALHRVLKEVGYKGWICVDLDRTRNGPLASYRRCGAYVTKRLEPIYL